MPLRDHFRPPVADVASWEELHGAWPATIAFQLNSILPPDYRSGVKVHLGTVVELDVATFEHESPIGFERDLDNSTSGQWAPAIPTLLLDTQEPTPPEYEVRVYDQRHGRRLVAAVEIVSPGNKDRPENRDAFVSKCHALLHQDVCVVIVDVVTDRSANLYAELADRMGAAPPGIYKSTIYAVACRPRSYKDRWRVETWEHDLKIGSRLPTLPLWLTDRLSVPLSLEVTYEQTCRGLRID